MLEGRNVSLKGAYNYTRRYLKRFLSPSFHRNLRKWKKLKGKYKGKRVFLIGNGPSLNKTPLYLLKNEYTMCFNRFELMTERFCWNPTFFAMSDTTVIEDSLEIINKTIDKADYSFFLSETEGNWNVENVLPSKDNILYFFFEGNQFSKKLPYLRAGRTIAVDGLQILNYLGFEEIIIIGVDMNYVIQNTADLYKKTKSGGEKVQSTEDDDPNHFDPRYFGKGAKYTNPNEEVMNNMLTSIQRVSEWFKAETDTKVINAGYDSKVDSFERKDFMDVLHYSEEKIDNLFEEVVRKFGYTSIDDFISQSTMCDTIEAFDDTKGLLSLPVDEAVLAIKKKILSFIPVGPYKGRVFFVNRSRLG